MLHMLQFKKNSLSS